jgi:hypothetical protein
MALTGAVQAASATPAPAQGSPTDALSLGGQPRTATISPTVAATLEQCTTAASQAGRSATFSGQMTAGLDAERMAMRIELEERTHHAGAFHVVVAPGLGVWRVSEPGVKIYKYIKQVTNLAAPAAYRALVRFKWTNSKGRLVKVQTLRTQVCKQPGLVLAGGGTGTTTITTTTTTSTTSTTTATS